MKSTATSVNFIDFSEQYNQIKETIESCVADLSTAAEDRGLRIILPKHYSCTEIQADPQTGTFQLGQHKFLGGPRIRWLLH